MTKIDLHTHSIASKDGGLKEKHYRKILEGGILDAVAVTDHCTTAYAKSLQKTFGQAIIVGQEIKTQSGELIGLYLENDIPDGRALVDTIDMIQAQNGIIYVPHPLETHRHSLRQDVLLKVINDVDIIEVHNGRAHENKSFEVVEFSSQYEVPEAASSDAHSMSGIGHTFMRIEQSPTQENLVAQVNKAHLEYNPAPIGAKLAPTRNRIKKTLFLSRPPKL